MRPRRAVTLVELLVVAVVLALVSTVVIPTGQSTSSLHLDLAAERLQADLAYARSQAILQRKLYCFVCDATQGYYYLAPLDAVFEPATEPISHNPYRVFFRQACDNAALRTLSHLEAYPEVELSGASFDGSMVLTFGAMGEPLASPRVPLTDGKIEIAVGTRSLTIVIDPATGLTRIQDPAGQSQAGQSQAGQLQAGQPQHGVPGPQAPQ